MNVFCIKYKVNNFYRNDLFELDDIVEILEYQDSDIYIDGIHIGNNNGLPGWIRYLRFDYGYYFVYDIDKYFNNDENDSMKSFLFKILAQYTTKYKRLKKFNNLKIGE